MKNHKSYLNIKTLSVVLVFILIFSGCGSSDDDQKVAPTFEEVTQSTRGRNFGNNPAKVPGFDGETISLGVVTPLSGLAGFLGQTITNGAQTYWDSKNVMGGVAGKYKVQLKTKDTASGGTYDKNLSVQAYDDLSDEVVAFQQVLGTDVVLSLNEKQINDNMVISPATLSGDWVRNPLVMSIATPYQTQAINGVAYYAAYGESTNPVICSLALDDSFGESGVEGVEFITKNLGLEYGAKEQFTSQSPITSQVNNIIKQKCNAVVVVATASDIASVITAFAGKNSDIDLIGLAPTWIPEADLRMTTKARQYAAEHFWVISSGAKWGDTSVEGMQKMLNDITAQRPSQQSNPFFLYGYAQAWAMDQLLEKAVQNGDLSSEGVARALANVGTFEFQGLLPDFEYGPNSSTRKVPDASTIYKYSFSDPSKLEVLADNAVDFASPIARKFKYE